MSEQEQDWRPDFEQAMGETFGECCSPPLPIEDASPHECCEVIWSVCGDQITPASLAALTPAQIAALATRFGEYFACDAPTTQQIEEAIDQTLGRWPVGSLGEPTE